MIGVMSACVSVYIHIYTYIGEAGGGLVCMYIVCIYVYVCIYTERERETYYANILRSGTT